MYIYNGQYIYIYMYIQRSDLTSLHAFQQYKGMHLGNKLRSSHIDYHNKKMKVQLAAQHF